MALVEFVWDKNLKPVGGSAVEIGFYAVAAVLGVVSRYYLGMTQACKVIGVKLSDSDTRTGFQDAVTPPSSANHAIVSWIAIAAVLGYTVYEFGWGSFGIAFAAWSIVLVIAGVVVIPKPESQHFLLRIYGSMANRYADYTKSGDTVRADAMKQLIDRMEQAYADRLGRAS